MTITITSDGGVGMRAVYTVRQDGKSVATISRFSHRYHWKLCDVTYHEDLASSSDLDTMKATAMQFDYPSPRQVYDTICERIEANRRRAAEATHGSDLARLTRDLIAGSNSARGELEKVLATIEQYATDRSDTGRRYTFWNMEIGYPKPPEENDGAEAA